MASHAEPRVAHEGVDDSKEAAIDPESSKLFVGMDVRTESIDLAVADDGGAAVRLWRLPHVDGAGSRLLGGGAIEDATAAS